ncbi:MAG TPA: CDP-alcohol phosphatidyltransferase family protein [Candidatus Nanopelagicales bacterium]|nr:CDP-alcohol phosphatidyltransferase family protein [Candidatus Nanopelagicales bacterium]
MGGRRPARPTIAQLREVTQPAAVRGRRTAEHWTGDLYMRRISPYVTRVLLPTGISANGVTWLMILSGWLATLALLLPALVGAVLAVALTQLQMMWDACDGEVARWRGTASPMGVFLDKFGHYTVETLIALALGVRAAGGTGGIGEHLGWVTLGALLAWLLCLNKALNDMVHAARAAAGLERLPDTAAATTPRSGLLARLRAAARYLPFHRIYHSIELTLIILVAAVVDLVAGDLAGTRVLLAVIVPLALLSVIGHFVAIVASNRVRAA